MDVFGESKAKKMDCIKTLKQIVNFKSKIKTNKKIFIKNLKIIFYKKVLEFN